MVTIMTGDGAAKNIPTNWVGYCLLYSRFVCSSSYDSLSRDLPLLVVVARLQSLF